jgi:hypothetical protein
LLIKVLVGFRLKNCHTHGVMSGMSVVRINPSGPHRLGFGPPIQVPGTLQKTNLPVQG